nr:abc transporter a family member 1 [Quercus suber]
MEMDEIWKALAPASIGCIHYDFCPSNIRIAPFLTPKYTDDEFWYIMKEVMGVLCLLGFPYPISCLISFSVFKKE